MSDGECTNPVHGSTQPRFSQSETHCRSCGGPKWKWASWSQAQYRIPILVHEIAAVERGRALARKIAGRTVETLLEEEISTLRHRLLMSLESERNWKDIALPLIWEKLEKSDPTKVYLRKIYPKHPQTGEKIRTLDEFIRIFFARDRGL